MATITDLFTQTSTMRIFALCMSQEIVSLCFNFPFSNWVTHRGNIFVVVHTNRVRCVIWSDEHTIHACYRWHSCYHWMVMVCLVPRVSPADSLGTRLGVMVGATQAHPNYVLYTNCPFQDHLLHNSNSLLCTIYIPKWWNLCLSMRLKIKLVTITEVD